MNQNTLPVATEHEKRAHWLLKFPNALVSAIIWVIGLIYLFGWHRAEVKGFQDGHLQLRKSHEELVKTVMTLEKTKVLQDGHNVTADKTMNDMGVRITRLEDAIPKITLLSSQIESLKETQKEMKDDVKKINSIEVQMVEMKNLLEKALQK